MKNPLFIFILLFAFTAFAQENKTEVLEVPENSLNSESQKLQQKDKKTKRLLKRRVIATFYENNQKLEVVYNRLFDFYYFSELTEKTKRKYLGKIKSLEDLFAKEPYKTLMLSADGRILVTEGIVKKNHYRIYHNFDEPDNFSVYKVTDGKEEFYESIDGYELETKKQYRKLVSREI